MNNDKTLSFDMRSTNERDLLLAALELADTDRIPFLAKACGNDRQLQIRVEKLLNNALSQDSFMEQPAADFEALTSKDNPMIGAFVDRYKLLEQIGEGGMGIVYVAEQFEPVRRKVALKIIKPGMDSRQVVARFELERQALALMDHPNIASIFDGGSTDAQLPYLVMELVRGMPITEYCDRMQLRAKDRLDLFVSVCQAVQHAHQKGIIHRDIKPTNILVTLHDGAPVVKVIDFGVAKLLDQTQSPHTIYTHFNQVLGTPMYMSPEQLELSGLPVDTRTDVYSLGVLLYELLTGHTPFDRKRLKQSGFDEFRRIVLEETPLRPSQIISTMSENERSTNAASRGVDQRLLVRELRGELDWITMKALEKDRKRRYESPKAMADDTERYLAGEAVHASPPSQIYQLRKFVNRNRGPVVATSLVAVGLLTTTVLSIFLLAREREIIDRRIQIQREITTALTNVENLREKSAANKFKKEILAQAWDQLQIATSLASTGLADSISKDQISLLRHELEQEERDQKLITDFYLIQYDTYLPDLQSWKSKILKMLADYGIEIGVSDPIKIANSVKLKSPQVVDTLEETMTAWQKNTLPPIGAKLKQARDGRIYLSRVSQQSEQLENGDEVIAIDPLANDTWQSVENMLLPQVYQLLDGEPGSTLKLKIEGHGRKDRGPRTVSVVRDSEMVWCESLLETLAPDPWRIRFRKVLKTKNYNEITAEFIQLVDDANLQSLPERISNDLIEELIIGKDYERAEKIQRVVMQKNPTRWLSYTGLGSILTLTKRHEDALRWHSMAVSLEPKNPVLRNALGKAFQKIGQAELALEEFRESTRLAPSRSDPNHFTPKYQMAEILKEQNRLDEACSQYRNLIQLAPKNPVYWVHYGNALSVQGDLQAAEKAYRESIVVQPDNPVAYANLSSILRRQRRIGEAILASRTSLQSSPNYGGAFHNLVIALILNGEFEEAIAVAKQFVATKPQLAGSHHVLSWAWRDNGDLENAVKESAHAVRLEPEDANYNYLYGSILVDLNRIDEAIVAYRKVWDGKTAIFPLERSVLNVTETRHMNDAFDAYCCTLRSQGKDHVPELILSKAVAYESIGRLREAARALRGTELTGNKDVPYVILRASIWSRLGHYDLASQDCTLLVDFDPTLPHYLLRAMNHRALGRYDLSVEDIQKGISLDSTTESGSSSLSEAFALLGDVYSDNLNEFDLAREAYERAIELDPSNPNYPLRWNQILDQSLIPN